MSETMQCPECDGTGRVAWNLKRAVGKNVRRLRKAAGFTQEKLSAQLSVTRCQLTNIEVGRSGIQMQLLLELAEALGCKTDDILRPTEGEQDNDCP